MRTILLALAAALITGCTTPQIVFVDRKVYHVLGKNHQFSGKTYAIEFMKPEQADSLEMQTHIEVLKQFLDRSGMKADTSNGLTCDYVFRVRFGIGKENMLGAAGTSSSAITATGINSSASSSIYTITEYTLSLDITVHDGPKLRAGNRVPVYEGQAFIEAPSNDTTIYFPALVTALMYDFPSKSGEMQRKLRYEVHR